MLYFVNGTPGTVFDISGLRQRFPSVSWGDPPGTEALAANNILTCVPTSQPTGNIVITGSHAAQISGIWTQVWDYRAMTGAELDGLSGVRNGYVGLIKGRARRKEREGDQYGAVLERLKVLGG